MSKVSGYSSPSQIPKATSSAVGAKNVGNKQSLKPDYEVSISKNAKELEKSLKSEKKSEVNPTEIAQKIHEKKFGKLKSPGIFFVSGFDWFGASSVKGNYDGIRDMAEAVEGARHYAWDQQEEILDQIKKRDPKEPIILVGHSFGGDAVVEIAQELNKIENGFRKIDLLVTLDSVGIDNDIIPQNVKKNLNFLAQGNRLINDGPNIAANYQRSEVSNFLRHEAHAELDDTTDIQVAVLEAISDIV
ncbi:MAG: hypothetical protein CME64_14445 [Halobacteriovoraceae bacterium]|nr:hypothetical protein [Halobacteriovoraceae bacterium]